MTEKHKRMIAAVIGVILCAISIALIRKANLGTDPLTSFVTGVANLFDSTYGVFFTIIIAIFLVVTFFLDRHYIGFCTIISLLFIGFMADTTLSLLDRFFPNETLTSQVIFLLIGLLVLCFSSSLYFTADLGVSAYDAMALIAADKKIAPFRFCRIATDMICVVIGYFLGANIGVGTVITAFFMGPVVDLFNTYFAKPVILGIYPEKKKKA